MTDSTIRQRDKFQVEAFRAFFRGAIVGGKTPEQAFATAIFESRDDKVERLLAKNPRIVKQWEKQRRRNRKGRCK